MKLYSPIFGEVYLDRVRPHLSVVVTIDKKQGNSKKEFLYDGRYAINGECMLFPSKDKDTWEGFVPPCKFEGGDVIYTKINYNEWVSIFKKEDNGNIITYIDYELNSDSYFGINNRADCLCSTCSVKEKRLASENEKNKLFKRIKNEGYTWDAETKTLEKLVKPKFKMGDIIKSKVDDENILFKLNILFI